MDTEEKNNSQGSPQGQPGTAPIIDVQPPKQDNVDPAVVNDQTGTSSQDFSGSDSETPSSQPAFEAAPADQNSVSSADTPQAPTAVNKPQFAAPKKHGAPLLVIGVAIVVAAVLAVFTILAFNKQDKELPKPSAGLNETQQTEQVTPQTVDNTSKEVDEAIQSIDSASDFSEDELSDSALGL